jgi:hypothetical protein
LAGDGDRVAAVSLGRAASGTDMPWGGAIAGGLVGGRVGFGARVGSGGAVGVPSGAGSCGCGAGVVGAGVGAGLLTEPLPGLGEAAEGVCGAWFTQEARSSGRARAAAAQRFLVRRLPALRPAAMTAPRSRSGTFRASMLRRALPGAYVREVPVGTRVGHGVRRRQRPVRWRADRALPAGILRLRLRVRQQPGHRIRP